MKYEYVSGPQNIRWEFSTTNSVKGYTAPMVTPIKMTFGVNLWIQSEQGTNYQKQSESLSFPDPVSSTASLICPSVYDKYDSGLGSALYSHQN